MMVMAMAVTVQMLAAVNAAHKEDDPSEAMASLTC